MARPGTQDYLILYVKDHRTNQVVHVEVHDRAGGKGQPAALLRGLRRHWLDLRFSHPMQSVQSMTTTHPEPILERLVGPTFAGFVVIDRDTGTAVHHELQALTHLSPRRRRRQAWWRLQRLRLRYRPPAYRVERTFCSSVDSFYSRYPDLA